MTKTQSNQVEANNRSMEEVKSDDRSQVFFFPKNTPPVSIKAENLGEAEALLEARNAKEHD